MFESICRYIQDLYNSNQVPLHAPIFSERDKVLVNECIDSTFVSSVGAFVGQFEKMVATYTGAQFAIATVNGTSALHIALLLAGVEKDTEVLTQSLTFVATANAILYTGAHPVFLDSADDNLGMCPRDLKEFCLREIEMRGGIPYNRKTGKRIAACLPMHVFGHPALVNEIDEVCSEFRIPLIEDAAESLGSFLTSGSSSKHTGNIGKLSILSFNGNKIITCGGGGMIITNDALLAARAKHLTTTAKMPHPWEFQHDQIGYNYRLPNLNAALACAQMERLEAHVLNKRKIAAHYRDFFRDKVHFIDEPAHARSNFWLNALQFRNIDERNRFLEFSNQNGVMTRPIWNLMTDLDYLKMYQCTNLVNARRYFETIVNIPSSVNPHLDEQKRNTVSLSH